jgi:Mg-chelatase subunit ChlD
LKISIYGIIKDSDGNPVQGADIELIIENVEPAHTYSNKKGEFEYLSGTDYNRQTLKIIIKKDGFKDEHEPRNYELSGPVKNLKITLNKIKSPIEEPTSNKNKPEPSTKSKLKISGTILDSRNKRPIQGAKIKLKFDKRDIAVYSDVEGKYEYPIDIDHIGKKLDIEIEKEGFENNKISSDIINEPIEKDFMLDEIKIQVKGIVIDENTNNPLEDVKIYVKINKEPLQYVISNKEGIFFFGVARIYLNEFIALEASKEGYKSKSEEPKLKDDLNIVIRLPRLLKRLIHGTILNSRNSVPIHGANIKLNIKDKQIASVDSDENGRYHYSTEKDYTGEYLDIIVEKDKFESKSFNRKIEGEIKLDIPLDELPPPMPLIRINGKIYGGAETPLEGANISFKVNNEYLKNIISSSEGTFSFEILGKYLNGFIEYDASKAGYQAKSDRIEVTDKALNIAILLKKTEPLPVDINCTLNRNYLTQRGGCVYLGIDIAPQKAIENNMVARPLNICLLIDSSASMMEADKMQNAKQAAIDFIEKLESTDYAAIVTFADKVVVVSEGTHVIDKNMFNDKINKITAGGLTELYKGLEKAYKELKKPTQTVYGGAKEPVREIILLSDGRPSDQIPVAKYVKLAKEIRSSGISIIALGLGNDYNEDLLSELADNSGGAWRHITSPDISSVFSEELDSARSVLYTDPRLVLHPRKGVEVSKVYMVERIADHDPTLDISKIAINDKDQYFLRDINMGETQRIVAKMKLPPRQEIENEEITEVHVKVVNVELSINTDFVKSSISKDVIAKYSKNDELLKVESDPNPRNMFMTAELTLMGKNSISDKTVIKDVKDRINTIMKNPGATRIQKEQLTKVRDAISKPGLSEEDKKRTKYELTRTKVRLPGL